MTTNIDFIRCGEFVKIGRGVDPEQPGGMGLTRDTLSMGEPRG